MNKLYFAALSLGALVACGGGTDSLTYQQAVDQANQMEAQARNLGVDSPCQQANQCGLLTFLEPSICPISTYLVYSTISATAAAASSAAAQEVTLAQKAISLAPPGPGVPCPTAFLLPPIPACVANRCQPGP